MLVYCVSKVQSIGLQEAALQGNPVNRSFLEALRPESFSSILILADDTEQWAGLAEHGCADNLADADSRCLASLLLLRDIQSSRMHYSNTRQSSKESFLCTLMYKLLKRRLCCTF